MTTNPNYDNNKNCYKCGAADVKLEKVEINCNCNAIEHFKKTCPVCGFTSYIHRHIIPIPENLYGKEIHTETTTEYKPH